MSVTKPFDIMRWDSPKEPDMEFLTRMMSREGLKGNPVYLGPTERSPEMKFDQIAMRVVVSGRVQYSFPGYGVIELDPGDILEINPGVLHDVIVLNNQPAIILEALK